MSEGVVWLVGAGPGDPELISVKGLRLIQSADAIVYDRLADKRLLDHARADAILTDVGKIPGRRVNRQEDINRLLVELGKAGKRVVRLKGGDPFVFGRGGEEAEALADAGIRFEVVPGITSAIAAPAYAGIPLTHRKLASSFTVVTGSEDPTKPDTSVDWQALAKSSDTLAVLMGQSNLRVIADALVRFGRGPQTPVALVQWGTEPYQRTLVGTLSDIADRAAAAGIGAPRSDDCRRRSRTARCNTMVRQPAAVWKASAGYPYAHAGERVNRYADATWRAAGRVADNRDSATRRLRRT